MKDVIVVCDNLSYKNNIVQFSHQLNLNKVVTINEIDIKVLPKYNLVIFLLDPFNMGNKFFLNAIKEILRVRKSNKTILFCIDDVNKLDEKDKVKVLLELESALGNILKNPEIKFISSYWATIYRNYRLNILGLEDLQKMKSFFITDEKGYPISGKLINSCNIENLKIKSGINDLIDFVKLKLNSIEKETINPEKNNILIYGPPNSGKSLLKNIILKNKSKLNIKEVTNMNDVNYKVYDKMLIILDLNIDKYEEYLEEVCSKYVEIEKVFIVNKIDEYMYHDKDETELKNNIYDLFNNYTSEKIFFLSCYYLDKLFRYESNTITIQDIINDKNIVLKNQYGIPIILKKYEKDLFNIFREESTIDEFNKCLEGIKC